MENRYYEPELDLDGTAEELYTQARNGHIENPYALTRIQDILLAEQKPDLARRVGYMKEREEELQADPDAAFTVGQLKLDYLDGFHAGVEDSKDGEFLIDILFEQERETVILHAKTSKEDGADGSMVTLEATASLPFPDFEEMDREAFGKWAGNAIYYNLQETDRTYPDVEEER